jgi:hypothetical protein
MRAPLFHVVTVVTDALPGRPHIRQRGCAAIRGLRTAFERDEHETRPHCAPAPGALVLGQTAAAPGTLHAQRAAIPHPVPLPVKILTLPCCRCLDGSVQTVNISTGSALWTIQPPVGPVQAASLSNNIAWTNALAPAQWVGTQNGVPGVYKFELRFRVPNCTIRPQVTVTGAFSADNGGGVFIVPGPSSPLATVPFPFGFQGTANLTPHTTSPRSRASTR